MSKLLPKILFYYSAIASFLITISTVFASQSIGPVIFATLFLPVTAYFIIEFFKQMRSLFSDKPSEGTDAGTPPKKGEVIAIVAIFLLLSGFSFWNISKGRPSGEILPLPSPSQSPLIFKSTGSSEPLKSIQISITDGSESVKIRQKPTVYSDKIGDAKDGDIFQYLSLDSGWYEIKYSTESSGFISAKYAKEIEQ